MKLDGVREPSVHYAVAIDYEHEHRDAEHEHDRDKSRTMRWTEGRRVSLFEVENLSRRLGQRRRSGIEETAIVLVLSGTVLVLVIEMGQP